MTINKLLNVQFDAAVVYDWKAMGVATTEILRNGVWEEVPRALEAKHFAYRMDFDYWIVDQFAEWYENHPEYWTEVNRVDPDAGIRIAYNAWLRRP